MLNSLATRVEPTQHPLLLERDSHQVMLVVITADKGLCGAFSSNIIKAAVKRIESDTANEEISMTLVGAQGGRLVSAASLAYQTPVCEYHESGRL